MRTHDVRSAMLKRTAEIVVGNMSQADANALMNGVVIRVVAAREYPSPLMNMWSKRFLSSLERSGTGRLAKLLPQLLKRMPSKTPWRQAAWMAIILCVGTLGMVVAGIPSRSEAFGIKHDELRATDKPDRTQDAEKKNAQPPRLDLYGDPLPAKALARIGTTRLRHHRAFELETTFLTEGKTVVARDENREIVFWETVTGKEIRRLREKLENSDRWAVSSNGKKLAIARRFRQNGIPQGAIQVWDIEQASPRIILDLRQNDNVQTLNMAFTPDGGILAVSQRENGPLGETLWLFNANTGGVRKRLNDLCGPYIRHALIFSQDGKLLATPKGILDMTTWEKRLLMRPDNGLLREVTPYALRSMAISADGKLLAAISQPLDWKPKEPYVLSLWSTTTGSETRRITSVSPQKCNQLSFSLDGRTLIQADSNGRFHFWDVATGKMSAPTVTAEAVYRNQAAFNGDEGTCFSADGKLFLRSQGPVLCIWNVETGKLLAPILTHAGMYGQVHDLEVSPDGKLLATKTPGNDLRVWNGETGELAQRLEWPVYIRSPLFYSSESRLTAWAWAAGPDKKELGRKGRFICWDPRTGNASPETAPVPDAGDLRAISENGQRLLWASKEKVVLIDRSTAKEIQHFPGFGDRDDLFVTLSADGETVLVEEERGELHSFKVYSANSGREIFSLDEPLKEISAWRGIGIEGGRLGGLALSPDGRCLAAYHGVETKGTQSVVRFWELASRREVAKFDVSRGTTMRCLLWSPDGRLLAGGDDEGTVWLWDVITLEKIGCLKGHRRDVISLAFSPDSIRLVSGSADTTALIWGLGERRRSKISQSFSAPDLWRVLGEPRKTCDAWRAIDELARRPEVALPFLRQQLKRPPVPDLKLVAMWLDQLDDSKFQVRKRSAEQLAQMDERIAPVLRKALERAASKEKRRLIEDVLKRVAGSSGNSETGFLTAKQLQAYRGVVVLERIGSIEATRLLEKLANARDGVQANESMSALRRLVKRRAIAAWK